MTLEKRYDNIKNVKRQQQQQTKRKEDKRMSNLKKSILNLVKDIKKTDKENNELMNEFATLNEQLKKINANTAKSL